MVGAHQTEAPVVVDAAAVNPSGQNVHREYLIPAVVPP
jgi:hypothetical protein